MGTRGAWGFVVDGQEKLAYNHFDSYPDALGATLLSFLRDADMDTLPDRARALRVVRDDEEPTAEDIERLRRFHDEAVSTGKPTEWYSLLRHTQGEPELTLEAGVIEDASTFPQDSLFCEWAYVIDLDEGVFEVYRGFQKESHNDGRFGGRPPDGGYHPVRLVASYPLDALPDTLDDLEE